MMLVLPPTLKPRIAVATVSSPPLHPRRWRMLYRLRNRSRAHRLPHPTAIGILGREAELTRLREWLELAMRGERQTVFVTGEAGMGKTTLVEAFLAQNTAGLRVARGQCLEHFGAGEAYLPVLDGISRLCRAPSGGPVLETLRQHAPAWMAQLPSLIPAAEREDLHAHALGATRERMLREMAEALEALTILKLPCFWC